jgi:hypothetical protein
MKPSLAPSRRASRPHLEALEHRALLSGLVVTLATDNAVYELGQPIQLTFTETNTSSQPQQILYGPSGDGFIVEQGGVPVWQSNSGPNPMWVMAATIEPGRSQTFTSTWNGVPNEEHSTVPLSGAFTVVNQQAPSGPSATFQILPAGGTVVPPIPQPQPAITATLATAQPSYRTGHRVSISLTLTNQGSQPVALGIADAPAGFTISHGSAVVGHGGRKAAMAHNHTAVRAQPVLAPGASKTIKLSWIARPTARGAKALAPGNYTIEAWDGGYTASGTIQLKA